MYHIYIYLSIFIFIHYKEWRFWKISYRKYISLYPSQWIHWHVKEGWSFWGTKRNKYFQNCLSRIPSIFFTVSVSCTGPHPHSWSIPTPYKNSCNKILVIGNCVCCFSPTLVIGNRLKKGWQRPFQKKQGWRDVSSMQQFQFSN